MNVFNLWELPANQKQLLKVIFQQCNNVELFSKFIETRTFNIWLDRLVTSLDIPKPTICTFETISFCGTIELCAAFARFNHLTTANSNIAKKKAIKCFVGIINYIYEAINHPCLIWPLIFRTKYIFTNGDREQCRSIYQILQQIEREKVIAQLISCALAKVCEVNYVGYFFLSEWIKQMTTQEFEKYIINSNFLANSKTVMLSNKRSQYKNDSYTCCCQIIESLNKTRKCSSQHAICLMYIINEMIFRWLTLIESGDITVGDEHESNFNQIVESNIINHVLQGIGDDGDRIGADSLMECEKLFVRLFCLLRDIDSARQNHVKHSDYLLFDTPFLKIFCKTINYCNKHNKHCDFDEMIDDFIHIVICSAWLDEDKDAMVGHKYSYSVPSYTENRHVNKIRKCMQQYFDISAQEMVNSIVLTHMLPGNPSVINPNCGYLSDLHTLLTKHYSHASGGLKDGSWNYARESIGFEFVMPYSVRNRRRDNSNTNKKESNVWKYVCLAIQSHDYSQHCHSAHLKFTNFDCYGVSNFGKNVGNFGILLYTFFNKDNLILGMEPINRQCLRILRTSMTMFIKYGLQRSIASDALHWYYWMKITFTIYSFYNIDRRKLDSHITRIKGIDRIDYPILNQNYQFVTNYLRRFVMDVIDYSCHNNQENTRDLFLHMKNHCDFLLAICFAFVGYKEKAVKYRTNCLKHGMRIAQIDEMIHSSIEIARKYQRQKESLKILKKIIIKRKRQRRRLHETNLVANAHLNHHKKFIGEVLDEGTRNKKLYLKWKNVTCVKKCNACGRQQRKLYKCANCRIVSYCSKGCQKKDWENHSSSCK